MEELLTLGFDWWIYIVHLAYLDTSYEVEFDAYVEQRVALN